MFIKEVAAVCDSVQSKRNSNKKIMLSFDEWNVWYHSNAQDSRLAPWQRAPHQLEDIYTVEDAVLVGSMLITLLKNADRVKMACLAQLVNVIAPIMTTDTMSGEEGGKAWRQTIFYPYMYTSVYGRGRVLHSEIVSPVYSCERFKEVSHIDSAAVLSEDGGELVFFVVNRCADEDNDVEVSFDLRSFGNVTPIEHIVYTSGDLKAVNGADETKNVLPERLNDVVVENGTARVVLKRVSWNMIRFEIKK
jgi:alpha-N-arabinofuranosidase